jgi:putative transposase
VTAIDRARERHEFHLWAWVIMPEHFHLIVYQAPGASPLSLTLKTIKQSVVTNAIHWLEREGLEVPEVMRDRRPDGRVVTRFWLRGGGYDRNLWSAEEVWEKVGYVHSNPVERGLCERAENWVWSSARVYRGLEGVLSLDLKSLPEVPRGWDVG